MVEIEQLKQEMLYGGFKSFEVKSTDEGIIISVDKKLEDLAPLVELFDNLGLVPALQLHQAFFSKGGINPFDFPVGKYIYDENSKNWIVT